MESLDFSGFDLIYAGAGHPAYHPRILMKTIIMGMLSRIRSSRKLASATRESFIFMYLAEKVNTDFHTIARFSVRVRQNPAWLREAKPVVNGV